MLTIFPLQQLTWHLNPFPSHSATLVDYLPTTIQYTIISNPETPTLSSSKKAKSNLLIPMTSPFSLLISNAQVMSYFHPSSLMVGFLHLFAPMCRPYTSNNSIRLSTLLVAWIGLLLRNESSTITRLTGTPFALSTLLSSYPWPSGFSNDPSSFASFFTKGILLGMDQFIPLVTSLVKKFP